MTVFHLPGLSSTFRDDADHLLGVQAGVLGEMDAFGKPLDDSGDAELVDHLGKLTCTRGSHKSHHLGIAIDDRLRSLERFRIAPDHHRQLAVLGTGLATGYGRIQAPTALVFCRGIKLTRHCRRSGGIVDVDRTLLHAGKCAVRAKRDCSQVIIIANTGEDEVAALSSGLRRRRRFAAMFRHPFVRFRGRAIEDREFMATPFGEMTGHGIAHDTKTDKRNFCHRRRSFPFPLDRFNEA